MTTSSQSLNTIYQKCKFKVVKVIFEKNLDFAQWNHDQSWTFHNIKEHY